MYYTQGLGWVRERIPMYSFMQIYWINASRVEGRLEMKSKIILLSEQNAVEQVLRRSRIFNRL